MHALTRLAGVDDATAVNDIANGYIRYTSINFDTQAWSLGKRKKWISKFNQANSPYRMLVSEMGGEIAGFACNTPFRPKNAYHRSTETSIYLKLGMSSRGIGEALYRKLFEHLAHTDLHRAFAIITLPNPASIRLHEKLGFFECGVLSEAGWKYNRFHSISIWEMPLKPVR